MNKVLKYVLQIILALPFLVFGLNKLIPFMEMGEIPGAAGTYIAGLAASGFTMPLLGIIMVLGGLALISNKYVPLALVLLAVPTVNIFLFHVVLNPMGASGIAIGSVLLILTVVLMYAHKQSYAPLFKA